MFSNRTINYLNLHMGLWIFGNTIVVLFGPIYLLKLGLSVPTVAVVWGAATGLRFFLRPLALLWIQKVGLKKSLIVGAFASAGIFPLLFLADGTWPWLCALTFYRAFFEVIYWLPLHAFYAIAGNIEKRGKQTAAREILMLIFSAAAPVTSGILTAVFGFWTLYPAGIIITLLSVWPLLHTAELAGNEAMPFRQAIKRIDRRGFWLAIGDNIFSQTEVFLWTICVFFLTQNLIVFGWILGLQIFLSSAISFTLGNLIDRGKGKKLFLVGAIGLSAVLLGRTFSVHTVTDVIISQILFALLSIFYVGPYAAAFYNMAKQTKNTLWFHFFAETGYDVGGSLVLFSIAMLVHLGFGVQQLLPIGILGIVIVKLVLNSYYTESKQPRTAD
jgi:MFS family permease